MLRYICTFHTRDQLVNFYSVLTVLIWDNDKDCLFSTCILDEEEKRQKTTAIPFSYDVPQNPEHIEEDIPTVEPEEVEEPYVPPPILDVPVDIEIVSDITVIVKIKLCFVLYSGWVKAMSSAVILIYDYVISYWWPTR